MKPASILDFARVAWRDLRLTPGKVLAGAPAPARGDLSASLDEAMAWLCRAQDASGNGGVSKSYIAGKGWHHPYPETTGYIIPTFLDYAARGTGREDFVKRAVRMGEWELSIQTPEGGIQQGPRHPDGPHFPPIVFNTGMVLKGFIRLHAKTREPRFLDGAVRAGDFLVERQDADGAWRRASYQAIPHTYHSRVAWSLLMLHEATGDARYRSAGVRHLDWVVSVQSDNGFFTDARFFPGKLPNTHSLAYTARGLVEGYARLRELRWLDAAVKVSEPVRRVFETQGHLPGVFTPDWTPVARWTCLTALAQNALVWYRLGAVLEDAGWTTQADRALDYLVRVQDRATRRPGLRGGIYGSHPVWGRYAPLQVPNWAVKFFADAMMERLAHAGGSVASGNGAARSTA